MGTTVGATAGVDDGLVVNTSGNMDSVNNDNGGGAFTQLREAVLI